MKQYIDKSALVAEIEKLYKKNTDRCSIEGIAAAAQLRMVLDFLDTLEVKEVDLEKEVDKWYQNKASKEFENVFYDDIEECAKHFFELGLKAKGE